MKHHTGWWIFSETSSRQQTALYSFHLIARPSKVTRLYWMKGGPHKENGSLAVYIKRGRYIKSAVKFWSERELEGEEYVRQKLAVETRLEECAAGNEKLYKSCIKAGMELFLGGVRERDVRRQEGFTATGGFHFDGWVTLWWETCLRGWGWVRKTGRQNGFDSIQRRIRAVVGDVEIWVERGS